MTYKELEEKLTKLGLTVVHIDTPKYIEIRNGDSRVAILNEEIKGKFSLTSNQITSEKIHTEFMKIIIEYVNTEPRVRAKYLYEVKSESLGYKFIKENGVNILIPIDDPRTYYYTLQEILDDPVNMRGFSKNARYFGPFDTYEVEQ